MVKNTHKYGLFCSLEITMNPTCHRPTDLTTHILSIQFLDI